MSLVAVGRLVGVFGIRGELKLLPEAGRDDTLAVGAEYALGGGAGAAAFAVAGIDAGPGADAPRVRCTSLRRHHKRLLIGLEGIATPEAAQVYVGRRLYAESAEVEDGSLAANEYRISDLVGLQVLDEEGVALGEVVGVEHFPAQDCLVIGAQRALVPLAAAFVRGVDLDARTIVMSLPEGLL